MPNMSSDQETEIISTFLTRLRKRIAFQVIAKPGWTQRVLAFESHPEQITVDFHALFQAWGATTSDTERTGLLQAWVDRILYVFQMPEVTRDQLVPLVRHATKAQWTTDMLASAQDWGHAPPEEYIGFWAVPFLGDMVVMLGVDQPDFTVFCTMKLLEPIDQAPDGLLAMAITNLGPLVQQPQITLLNERGLYALQFPANSWVTPSALLLPELLDRAMENAGMTSALFAVPAQEGIVFCDASLGHASELMAWAIGAYRKSDRPQSDCIFARARGDAGFEFICMVHQTGS